MELNTFKIESRFIEKLHIPAEANMKYLGENNLESARLNIEQLLSKRREFESGVSVSIEKIPVPRENFDINLFEDPTIKLLCYIGSSYPRYFNDKKIHNGCYELYEFGNNWSENKNKYYFPDGSFSNTEVITKK